MFVPNYVPEPESIADNVTQLPYQARLEYIRAVLIRFLFSCLVCLGVGMLLPRHGGALAAFVGWAALLLTLSGYRTLARGKPVEARVSAWLLPVAVVATAWLARCLVSAGHPVWACLIGIGCFGIYAVSCGRDFSFVGGYVLAAIVSSVIIACIQLWLHMTPAQNMTAVGANLGTLLYVVYDLASLLARRRRNEVAAAVTDLYRDSMNLFGWVIRVVRHWRRHRILSDLSFEFPFGRP